MDESTSQDYMVEILMDFKNEIRNAISNRYG